MLITNLGVLLFQLVDEVDRGAEEKRNAMNDHCLAYGLHQAIKLEKAVPEGEEGT